MFSLCLDNLEKIRQNVWFLVYLLFQKSPKDTQLADLFNDQRSAFTQRRKPFKKRPFRWCARKVVVVFSRVAAEQQ